jgi:hypothetical protein
MQFSAPKNNAKGGVKYKVLQRCIQGARIFATLVFEVPILVTKSRDLAVLSASAIRPVIRSFSLRPGRGSASSKHTQPFSIREAICAMSITAITGIK